MRRRHWLNERRVALLMAALALLAVRLPFLPPTLEDIDSVNFDLGVHDFDVPHHRPHPPGYTLFIAAAKMSHAFQSEHAAALGLVAAVFGALTVWPLYTLLRRFTTGATAALTCVITLFCPIVWFNGVRPMSDTTGLFFVVLAQAALVGVAQRRDPESRGDRMTTSGAGLLAGLALGVRLQALFLIAPVFLFALIRRRKAAGPLLLGGLAGVLAWMVPLVVASGGIAPIVNSFLLLVRDALPAEPLVTRFTYARALDSLRHVFVDPWGAVQIARGVLLLAAVGFIILAVSARRSLALALLLFLPYGLYHYALQMTDPVRYAIPLVPLVAFCAATTIDRLGEWMLGSKTAAAMLFMAIAGLHTYPALTAYHRTPSPPVQAISYLRDQPLAAAPMRITGHFVFERYLQWLPDGFTVMPPRPRRPQTVLADHWERGGQGPILFLRDPARTMLYLFAADSITSLQRWQWPATVAPFMRGERPGEIELVRLTPPEWFSRSGFLLSAEAGTPESIAREPHVLYVRSASNDRVLSISGSLPAATSAHITMRVGGQERDRWTVGKTFHVQSVIPPEGLAPFVPVLLESRDPVLFTNVSLEPLQRHAIRLGEGFFLPEHDEKGMPYRWMAPRARAEIYLPAGAGRLSIRGRIPIEHYELPVILTLTWNGKPLPSIRITTMEFEIEQQLEAPFGTPTNLLELESSHRFVPSEREGTDDQRVLAVRLYGFDLDAPAPAAPRTELHAEDDPQQHRAKAASDRAPETGGGTAPPPTGSRPVKSRMTPRRAWAGPS